MPMYSYKVWGNGHSHGRTIIPETVNFHKRWELFMPKRYDDGRWSRDYWAPGSDPKGPPTRKKGDVLYSIFYGHAEGGDNPPFIIDETMEGTEPEGAALLKRDIAIKLRWVNARVPTATALTDYMLGALVSLVYQYGQGRIDKRVEEEGLLIPKLNEGKYVQAFVDILKFDTKKDGTVHPGLTLRRASEVGFLMTKLEL